MKKYILLICALVLSTTAFSQSKKELEAELKSTKAKLDSFQFLYFQQQSQYQQKIVYLESVIDFFMTLFRNLDGETRTETLFYLQFTNECALKLYCEVMR